VVLLAAFAAFTLFDHTSGRFAVDRAMWDLSCSLARSPLRPIVGSIAPLGDPNTSAVLMALLAGVALLRRQWLLALLVLGAMVTLSLVEAVLRLPVRTLDWRNLPDLLTHSQVLRLANSTYPSGHVARTALLAGVAVLVLPSRLAWVGIAGAVLCSLLMAVQRVAAGHHTGSDVVGGLLLGGGIAAVVAMLTPLPLPAGRMRSDIERPHGPSQQRSRDPAVSG
jgi:membrane-associated phospholipid phosphatase